MEILLIIVIGVIFGFSHSKLQSRITILEEKLKGVTSVSQVISPVQNSTENQPFESVSSEVVIPSNNALLVSSQAPLYGSDFVSKTTPITSSVYEKDLGTLFVEWLKKDLLMKIGALFLLMGIGWFVSYAFIHNWIGPAGRIALGLLTGAGVLSLGIWRIKERENQGAIFTVLGSTVVIMTVFSARMMYDMFTPVTALGLMFVSTLFVTFVSLMYKRNSLALASLILAGIAPYLTYAPTKGMIEDFIYLLVIVLGTLWVVYITGWRNLTFTALIITAITTIPYSQVWGDKYVALMWAFVFTAIFFVANVVSLIRQRGKLLSTIHLYTALGTALYLAVWIFGVVPETYQSLLFVAWMLVFSFGTYLAFRSTGAQAPFYIYGGTSAALLAAAIVAEFEGAVLTIMLTFEVAIIVFASSALRLGSKVTNAASLLFVVPILLSFESIASSAWKMGVIHEDLFNLLILTLVLLIVGLFVFEQEKVAGTKDMQTGGVLITIGSMYGIVLIWLVIHALIKSNDVATMYTLILYTILGVITYFKGLTNKNHSLKIGGGALVGFVVVRLLLIDVWSMDLPGRILTFIAIGVLLLSTAFFRRGKDIQGESQ